MLFSQRKGLTPALKDQQIENIDDALRNRLWNLLSLFIWDRFSRYDKASWIRKSNFEAPLFLFWNNFFKWPTDEMPRVFGEAKQIIKSQFFKFLWYQVYDFIEFSMFAASAGEYPPLRDLKGFEVTCNKILKEENSAYRLLKGHFVQITSEEEIKTIEEALADSVLFPGVKTHLSSALEHLSNRKNPDYRNSIKESLSAVESACQTITGDKNATLGQALKLLEKHQTIHGALKNGFSSIYGYANDADGIRHAHALDDEPNITFVDAKFMLVACSAFVNYLTGKVAELNIELPQST
jgi:hypothetical protein